MSRERVLKAAIMAGLPAVTTWGAVGTAEAMPRRCAQLHAAAANEWSLADAWWSAANSWAGIDQAKYDYAVSKAVYHDGRGYAAHRVAVRAGC